MAQANTLLLASASPRRAELLRQIGVSFQVVAHGADESRFAEESPREYVNRIALLKARSVLSAMSEAQRKKSVVLASDTTVVLGEATLGKPQDEADAIAMLLRLSATTHQVMTSVVVADSEVEYTDLSVTDVTFREISETQARSYWHTGEPEGKAGAYAIQGKGAVFAMSINGSYSGVMGLPLYETAALLDNFSLAS